MTEYWYARRFPVGHWSNAMAPVSPKARRVVWVFAAGVAAGMLSFFVFGLLGHWRIGAGIFAVLAGAGSWYYLTAPMKHFDRHHTVDDYRSGKVGSEQAPESGVPLAPATRLSLSERFGEVGEYWRPTALTELNGQTLRLARVIGSGPWQQAANGDVLLLVWKGRLRLELRARQQRLAAGDVFVVPSGEAFRLSARREAQVAVLGPAVAEDSGPVEAAPARVTEQEAGDAA